MVAKHRHILQILFASSHQLCYGQIMRLYAGSLHGACIRSRNHNQSIQPPFRKYSRLWPNSVRIIPKFTLKGRSFSNRSINQFGSLRMCAWIEIRFHRNQQLRGRIRKLPKNRLASHNNNVIDISDHSRRANQVFQLQTRHRSPIAPSGSRSPQTGSLGASPAWPHYPPPSWPLALPLAWQEVPATHQDRPATAPHSQTSASNCHGQSPATPGSHATSPQ